MTSDEGKTEPLVSGRISSPAATGGAGTYFEQHVDAFWLALLLVGAIPPIIKDCIVVEVSFQTEHLGLMTDDFLIVGVNAANVKRRIIGQVKRTFTVSSTDDECKKTITDFWADFRNSDVFSTGSDRFVLVTLRGTNVLLSDFTSLLECARTARDSGDFARRLATAGLVSTKARGYFAEVRTIVEEACGESVSDHDVWMFLRSVYVLSLDLNTDSSQTEANILSLFALTSNEKDFTGAASDTWNALLAEVGSGATHARSYRREDLPERVRARHVETTATNQPALRALAGHSNVVLDGITDALTGGLHIAREQLCRDIAEQSRTIPLVLVTGPAGGGKSAIAKEVLGQLAVDHFVFVFRAEEFEAPHLDNALVQAQIPCSADQLGGILAGQDQKVLLIESVERLLEASVRDAFMDLIRLVARDASWRLIVTCRDYSVELVRTALFGRSSMTTSVVEIPPLNDEELAQVEAKYPSLALALSNPRLRHLLRNPYVLDRALQISWSIVKTMPECERDLRRLYWRDIVRADHVVGHGMPQRRGEAFAEVALRRAHTLRTYANCSDLESEVLGTLKSDSLLLTHPSNANLVCPSHDVLEDWAILQWIDEQYAACEGQLPSLADILGTYPAVRRSYRKWLTELVDDDADEADRVFQRVTSDPSLDASTLIPN